MRLAESATGERWEYLIESHVVGEPPREGWSILATRDWFRDLAARELESESSKHFSAATKMISMTEERRAALDRAARFIMWADHAGHLREGVASKDAEIIRGMLAEAER